MIWFEKKIQCDFMNKIYYITKRMQETYEARVERGVYDMIKRFISHWISLETASECSGLSVTEIENLLKECK